MKKIIFIIIAVLSFGAEGPYFDGAYFGNVKTNITDKYFYSYTSSAYSYAGKLYLYENKLNVAEYILNKKDKLIAKAIKEAEKYAKEKHKKFYAVDNIKFDIKITEDIVYLFMDYNVVVYDN